MPAFYRANVTKFLEADPKAVLGQLTHGTAQGGFANQKSTQTQAWEQEIQLLRQVLIECANKNAAAQDWGVLLEYPIPRRQKRIDAVLLAGSLIFVLEFKIGATQVSEEARVQAEDYALDLRDFHAESRQRNIIPIVIASLLSSPPSVFLPISSDPVQRVISCNPDGLAAIILRYTASELYSSGGPITLESWDHSAYHPVPTIIEAATQLYSNHSVQEITQAHADVFNLTETTNHIIEAVKYAQENSRKVICFVTGVPGSGKTLAGLNAVHDPELRGEGRSAGVFLSGNGPLVKIVSEALARDAVARNKTSISKERRDTRTFIQNVHVFLRHYLEENPQDIPFDRVVIFDEAQRAWDAAKSFKKFGRKESEPIAMLSVMDRHSDWAVIVALVGGGQEIYDGEAGLAEWGRALSQQYSNWEIRISPEALHGGTSVAGHRLFDSVDSLDRLIIGTEPKLHLPVSIRSFTAQRMAEWVNALLEGQAKHAQEIALSVPHFPVNFTRSLSELRQVLRTKTHGTRRHGLIASSGALRLRAMGLEVSTGFTSDYPYEEWFLANKEDFRSSFQMEVAATEFQCQGLELDWVGLCWGDDLTWSPTRADWDYRILRGKKWNRIIKPRDRTYLLNKYRVLLTRAREGIVIWIPEGNPVDPTREPKRLDATAEYLQSCGVSRISI